MTGIPCQALVLATGNRHKVRELSDLLSPLQLTLQSLADFPGLQPVVEDGQSLAENARKKAAAYAQQLGTWVLADDTGLEVDALGGEPGVRSARYAGAGATMAENRAKLLADLERVPAAQRSARFVCHLAVASPTGQIVATARGECRGRIRTEPTAGPFGFGYDVLFEVPDCGKTLAELPPEETAVIGHRSRAVQALLAKWLSK